MPPWRSSAGERVGREGCHKIIGAPLRPAQAAATMAAARNPTRSVMRTSAVVSLPVMLLCCWALEGGGDKKKFEDPTPRKDAILKRFAGEFVALTPGKGKFPAEFVMGSKQDGDKNERPAPTVAVNHSFAIGKFEVTQELYHVVMGNNPANWQGAGDSAGKGPLGGAGR